MITKVNLRGIDGTSGYCELRRNSGCSAEQKILRIPLRTLPRKRKQLGIPFRGTEIEAKSSFPNPSAEEKTTRNSVHRNRNTCKLSEFPSKPFSGRENNSEFRSESFRGRENISEQNAAVAVSDSSQIVISCRIRTNWFPPPW